MSQTMTLDLTRDLWWTSNDLVNMHRMTRHRKSSAVRLLAKQTAKQVLTPVGSCRLTVTACLPTARTFDPSNIAGTVAKHAIDGLTDAGIWADDDSEHVVETTYKRGPKTSVAGIYRLVFTLEEVTA